jgi:hypothetical protein
MGVAASDQIPNGNARRCRRGPPAPAIAACPGIRPALGANEVHTACTASTGAGVVTMAGGLSGSPSSVRTSRCRPPIPPVKAAVA